jgi:hypothetical protein
MRETVLSLYSDSQREVFLAEIEEAALAHGHAYDLGDDHGYFICEIDRPSPFSGVEILGKVASYEAALRLADLYAISAGKR